MKITTWIICELEDCDDQFVEMIRAAGIRRIADTIGISPSYLSCFIRNKGTMSQALVERISQVLENKKT